MNISAKTIAKIAREELGYSRRISDRYVAKILKSNHFTFKTFEKFRQKKFDRHSQDSISKSGRMILSYLSGPGCVIWFDVTKFKIGGGAKKSWIRREDLKKPEAEFKDHDGEEYEFMVSYLLGGGAISVTIAKNFDWSTWAYHFSETCRYMKANFRCKFIWLGDNATYHDKGVEEIHKILRKKKDKEGCKFIRSCIKHTLPGYSISNAIENGVFSAAKTRFYYSGIRSNPSTLIEILKLFPTSHEKNLNLGRNYLKMLEKMLFGI